jgi:hypothetical protein
MSASPSPVKMLEATSSFLYADAAPRCGRAPRSMAAASCEAAAPLLPAAVLLNTRRARTPGAGTAWRSTAPRWTR